MFKNFSFKWKILCVISVILIFALILFSLLVNIYEKNLLLKINDEKGRVIVETIKGNLDLMMLSGTKLQFFDFLNSKKTYEIRDISILNNEKKHILFSTEKHIEGSEIKKSTIELLHDIKSKKISAVSFDNNMTRTYFIYLGNSFFKENGSFVLKVNFSQKRIYDFINKQTKQIVFLSVFILIIGFIGSFFFGTIVTSPIKKLTTGTFEIGNGNLDYKININSNDEFGSLANSFNQMAENLKFAQKQIIVKEIMDRDFKIAMDIQNALFKQQLPESNVLDIATHYEFARQIGGDYYEVLKANDETTVLVADVSGKGIPGSLIMVMLRSLIRAQFHSEHNLKKLILKVNRMLMEDITPGKFVTLLIAKFNESTNKLDIINAGHIPLYKYIAGKNKIIEIVPNGLGLGLDAGVIFEQNLELGSDEMQLGDIYVFCTDGVTEAMNKNREQFGEERLKNAVVKYKDRDSTTILKNIKTDIKEFLQGEEFNDDFTMVVVKRINKEA